MLKFSIHYFMLFTLVSVITPYFQVFLRARGFSRAEVGYLQGIMLLASVAAMVIGYLADRFGKRRTMLIAALLALAAFMIPMNLTTSFLLAGLLAVGVGFTYRTPIPLTDALATHELPDPARQYGRVRVWGSLGFATALLLIRGLGLVNEKSSTAILTATLITAGLCLASTLLLPDHHKAGVGSFLGSRSVAGFDGTFWLFIAAGTLQQLGMIAHYSFFSLYLRDVLHMEQTGWVWSIGSVAEIPVLFFGAWIIGRLGLGAAMIASMAGVVVRLLVYALAPVLAAVLAVQVLHCLTFGLYHVTMIEFIRRKVSPQQRGLAMAIYMSVCLGVSGLIGSAAGGVIIEKFGYSMLYLSYAIPPAVGIVALAVGLKKMNIPAAGR